MEKKINSKCPICNERFGNTYKLVGCIYPCNHLIHADCFNKIINCPLCSENIHEFSYGKYILPDTQEHCDIQSVQNTEIKKNIISYIRAIKRIILLLLFFVYIYISQLFFNCDMGHFIWKCNVILKIFKVNIEIEGLENIDEHSSVFIFNHSSLFDMFVTGKVLGLIDNIDKNKFFGIGSVAMLKNIVASTITEGTDLIMIKRCNNEESTFDKITKRLDDGKILGIFPQGIIANNNTITEFRSSVFNLNKPINPIVINYSPWVTSMLYTDMLFSDTTNCKVKCLEKIYDSDPKSFKNKVTEKMIVAGEFNFSRITSRDVTN